MTRTRTPARTRHIARRPARAAALTTASLLVAWAGYLAISLPHRHTAAHWEIAWAGFDLALASAFGATAWTIGNRPELVPSALLATAAIMLCDSWFDVATAVGTGDQIVALVEASFEVPLALLLACLALGIVESLSASGVMKREGPACAGPSTDVHPRLVSPTHETKR
jgi:hypothetical protein